MENKGDAAFTLIEVIAAVSLALLLVAACLTCLYHAGELGCLRERRMTAANLAYSTLEHLREKGRKNFSADADLASGAHTDYAGITVPAGYTVSYVAVDNYWPEDPNNQPNNTHVNYKSITVTAAYPDSNALTMTGYVVEDV